MKRAALGTVLAALLILIGGALAGPAFAHTELESTSVADGAVLDVAPDEIDLVFSEAPLPDAIDISVTDASGNVLATSLPVTVSDATVSAVWPTELTDGAYTVNYRIVSDDGHPVTGSFAFTVGAAASGASTTDGAAATAEPSGDVPGRTLLIVAIVTAAIVVVAIVLITRRNRDDQP